MSATIAESLIRVLVVDDDSEWARQLGKGLEKKARAQVDYEDSLEGATRRIASERYDIVIVDIWFGDQQQTGDDWLLEHKERMSGTLKILFTADETRGKNWSGLAKAKVHTLRKLTHEARFYGLIDNIVGRLNATLGQRMGQPDLFLRATPEQAATFFWPQDHELNEVQREGGELILAPSMVTRPASAVRRLDRRLRLRAYGALVLELALGTVGAVWILGFSFWISVITFMVLGVGIAIWHLAVWSRHPKYGLPEKAAIVLAAFILIAELALLINGAATIG